MTTLFRTTLSVLCPVLALIHAPARAEITVVAEEIGGHVWLTATGSANVLDLDGPGTTLASPSISPSLPGLSVGERGGDGYEGELHGPANFGVLNLFIPYWQETGGSVGFRYFPELDNNFQPDYLYLPEGYISGSQLHSTAAWANTNFEELGMSPGTYTWTWGSGQNADSLTLIIPEPGTAILLTCACLAIRRRR